MTYKQALRKRKIETALAWPLVIAGKLTSKWFRPSGKHKLFIFSSSGDIGGANLNNADIAKMFPGHQPIVIFSKRPKNNLFRHYYVDTSVSIWDLHKRIDYKWYHFVNIFYRGVIAQWINQSPETIVIGGESLYFHKVLPWLKKNIRTIELSHLGTWFDYTQQFVKDIDIRVFSTKRLLEDARQFYDRQALNNQLKSRMIFIDNMVRDFEEPRINEKSKLEVIFIGRASPQKRVYLIAKIAEKAFKKKLPLHFSFVGDVSSMLNSSDYPYCTFYGNVKGRSELTQIQRASDVLILASAFEGLPMSVMEMMGLGKAVVSTAVNAIPDYIKDGYNGFLIPDSKDENQIVNDTILALSILANDRELLYKFGENNINEAKEKFGIETFFKKWNHLINQNLSNTQNKTA